MPPTREKVPLQETEEKPKTSNHSNFDRSKFNFRIEEADGLVDMKNKQIWNPEYINLPTSNGLFKLKRSRKWIANIKEETYLYGIPFVDHEGVITCRILYYTRMTPSQFLISLTSTVYYRLMTRFNLTKRRIKHQYEVVLFRIASYYAYSLDKYLFDRVTKTLFKSFSLSRRLSFVCFTRTVNFRFYYIQALQTASWIKSRGRVRSSCSMSQTLNGIFSSETKLISLFVSNKKKTKIYRDVYSQHGRVFRVEDKHQQSVIMNSLTLNKSVNPFRRYHM